MAMIPLLEPISREKLSTQAVFAGEHYAELMKAKLSDKAILLEIGSEKMEFKVVEASLSANSEGKTFVEVELQEYIPAQIANSC